MDRKTTSKVLQQQDANLLMDMLVYRENSYPARVVQCRDGKHIVAVDWMVNELLDGMGNLDPVAFELNEAIACYCTEEEILRLTDERLEEIIYEY